MLEGYTLDFWNGNIIYDPGNPDHDVNGNPRAGTVRNDDEYIRAAGSYALVASALRHCEGLLAKLDPGKDDIERFAVINTNLQIMERNLIQIIEGE